MIFTLIVKLDGPSVASISFAWFCCVFQLELQGQEVVVYDQSSSDPSSLSSETFLSVLLAKLEKSFSSVHLLSG